MHIHPLQLAEAGKERSSIIGNQILQDKIVVDKVSRSGEYTLDHHRGLRRRTMVRHCSSDTYYRNDP